MLTISPNLKRIAYIKTNKQGLFERYYQIVVDGLESELYKKVHYLTFSPDSTHVAAVVTNNGSQSLIVDNIVQFTFPSIWMPIFSHDSQRLAFAGLHNSKWCVFTNGSPGHQHDRVDPRLLFSPNDQSLVYRAEEGGQEFIVLNGTKGPSHAATGENSMVFSNNSNRFAYAAQNKSGRWCYIVDDNPGRNCNRLSPFPPSFSPDSLHFAYSTAADGKEIIIVDDKYFDRVHGIVGKTLFSPDSASLFYSYKSNKNLAWHIRKFIPGGEPEPMFIEEPDETRPEIGYPIDHIYSLAFTAAGGRFLYCCAPQNEWHNPSGLIPSTIWDNMKLTPTFVIVIHGASYNEHEKSKYFEVSKGDVWDGIFSIDGRQIFSLNDDSFSYIAFKKSDKTIYEVSEILSG